MNGLELLTEIKKESNVPVIVKSSNFYYRKEAKELGAYRFFSFDSFYFKDIEKEIESILNQ